MKSGMKFRFQVIVVLCTVVLSTADEEHDNNLRKLWSVNGDGAPPQSSSFIQSERYAFKPRAIALKKSEEPSQRSSVYYSPEYKSEVLFPGNYFRIAKEKSDDNINKDAPVESEPFHPKAIPLMRNHGFQKRSINEGSEPLIEKPEEEQASRRSISYLFDDLEDDEEEDRDDDFEAEVDNGTEGFKSKIKKPKIKTGKLKKYVLPLLLAYKMKYFALVPVMIGGLILLVGATGLAGFFFALFAAVMGLQKGGY